MSKKTALLSAVIACGVASAASADVKVTLGGSLDTQFGVVKQKNAFTHAHATPNAKHRLNSLNNSGDIRVNVDGTMENSDLKYGGLMKFNANTSDAKGFSVPTSPAEVETSVDTNVLQQAMMYVETPFGKVELGSTGGVAQAMKVGAPQVASNDWMYYVAPQTSTGALARLSFLQSADLFTNSEALVGTKTLNANKVNLYTPKYMGFMLGLTYTPDLAVRGTSTSAMSATKFASASNVSYKDVFQGGVSYDNTFNDVNVKAALLGETGKSKLHPTAVAKQRKLQAYEAGLQVSYMGFGLGGSYGSHGKSAALKSDVLKESKYWTIGASYAYGPASASLSYMDSSKGIAGQVRANKLRTTSFGVDYKVAEGFVPYASVTNFKMKDRATAATSANSGNIYLVGSKLNF